MAASSVTGRGSGVAEAFSLKDLAHTPYIIFSGIQHTSAEPPASPPADSDFASVTFPYPLPGGVDNYIIMLTTITGGTAYVIDREEDDDGNFTKFYFTADSECDVMYLVARVGSKPQ